MPIPTINQTILRGKLSIGYAANDNSKGGLWEHRIASPGSPVAIAMVTDALEWSTEGRYTSIEQREIANYLIWLTGIYGQRAELALQNTDGGGSVVPGGSSLFRYPLRVFGDDFENDGISFNNPNIVGDNLMIFISGYNEEWLFAPDAFIYTATGIQIVIPDFDANAYAQIIIDQYFPPNQ